MNGRNGIETRHPATRGILYLFGSIDTGSAAQLCERVIQLNLEDSVPHIQLIINSPGGNVDAGFAIIDIMEWSQIPIYTTGIGTVASMGLLILMAGEPGHRVITPRTSILSHRFSAWSVGNHSNLVATRKEQDLTHCRIVNHYIQHTNVKTEEELNRTLLRDIDVWLSPEETVRYGIADEVQTDRKRHYPGVVTRDLARTLELEAEAVR